MKGTACASYQRSAVDRRAFLSAGLGGLSVPAVLQARAMAAASNQLPADTAVIQYWLGGAASHFETYDPKPLAPIEVRGPFQPLATNVTGTRICETLPLHAQIMNKVKSVNSSCNTLVVFLHALGLKKNVPPTARDRSWTCF